MSNETKTQTEQDKAAAAFKATDISRRAADANGHTKTATTNHGYPTFPHSGSKTHLGQIGRAFEDIDNRIDQAAASPAVPDNATTSEPGLMSAEDKTKLDGLQNYTLPAATASTLGGVKVGTGLTVNDGTLSTEPMAKIAYIEDPAGDTVTKAEFIALRNALVAAGYMAAKA